MVRPASNEPRRPVDGCNALRSRFSIVLRRCRIAQRTRGVRTAALAQASRRWLLAQAANTGATVFPAHFPETPAGFVREGPYGFEWTYVEGVK
jgi:hypothetical protein